MGRNKRDKGDLFSFYNSQNFSGFERAGRVNINGGPNVGKGEGEKGGIDMAQRHHIHTDVMVVETKVNGIDEIKCNM